MITPSFSLTATERVLPKLALDFTTASLDSRITFTRTTGASNPATYVNSSGVITAATNNQPRFDYDPVTLACKGLLIEESRTNLLSYSANVGGTAWNLFNTGTASLPTVTLNHAVAPDGTNTASRLQMTLNGGTGSTANYCTVAHSAVSMTSGASYAQSIYLKSNDGNTYTVLLRDDSGSGAYSKLLTVTPQWQRFDQNVVASATAGSGIRLWLRGGLGTSDTVDILAWGAQYELGTFATSYIPTTSAALTRNADVATMTGANFSDWFNASQGTLCATGTTFNGQGTVSYANALFAVTDNVNDFCCLNRYVNAASGTVRNGGVTQASFTVAGGWLSGETHSAAIAYKDADFGYALGGVAEAPVTSGSIPAGVDRAYIGRSFDGSDFRTWNGHVLELSYYPQRLTDAELAAITA